MASSKADGPSSRSRHRLSLLVLLIFSAVTHQNQARPRRRRISNTAE